MDVRNLATPGSYLGRRRNPATLRFPRDGPLDAACSETWLSGKGRVRLDALGVVLGAVSLLVFGHRCPGINCPSWTSRDHSPLSSTASIRSDTAFRVGRVLPRGAGSPRSSRTAPSPGPPRLRSRLERAGRSRVGAAPEAALFFHCAAEEPTHSASYHGYTGMSSNATSRRSTPPPHQGRGSSIRVTRRTKGNTTRSGDPTVAQRMAGNHPGPRKVPPHRLLAATATDGSSTRLFVSRVP